VHKNLANLRFFCQKISPETRFCSETRLLTLKNQFWPPAPTGSHKIKKTQLFKAVVSYFNPTATTLAAERLKRNHLILAVFLKHPPTTAQYWRQSCFVPFQDLSVFAQTRSFDDRLLQPD
jgi:hypothetical protein